MFKYIVAILLVVLFTGIFYYVIDIRSFESSTCSIFSITEIQTQSLSNALKMYRMSHESYPPTEEGWAELISNGYLQEQPLDPWDNPFIYKNSGNTITIKSLGSDGLPGGEGSAKDLLESFLSRKNK